MAGLLDIVWSAVFSRSLSPRPSIRRVGNRLVVASSWRTSLLTIGAVSHEVTIDPQDKLIRIRHRTCWAYRTTQWIRFSEISEIAYDYRDMLDSGWFSHRSQDLYSVGVWLKSNEEVTFFRFYGEGDFINNSLIVPDWMKWGDFLEAEMTRGNQGGLSRQLADTLSGLIGVPVGGGAP